MGHSGEDTVYKIPHKMKTLWQKQLKISVFVWFTILYRIRYKKIDVILVQCPLRLLFMKSYCVFANDSIRFKGPHPHFSKFPRKTHYLGLGRTKLKAAHPVNYFPGFLGKNIKSCPPSKLFLFTSLSPSHPHFRQS